MLFCNILIHCNFDSIIITNKSGGISRRHIAEYQFPQRSNVLSGAEVFFPIRYIFSFVDAVVPQSRAYYFRLISWLQTPQEFYQLKNVRLCLVTLSVNMTV